MSQLRVKEAEEEGAPDGPTRQRPRFLGRARLPGRLAPRNGGRDDENGGRPEMRWWEWLGLDVQPTEDGRATAGGNADRTTTAAGKAERGESFLARAAGRIGDALVLGPRPPRSSAHAGALTVLERISRTRDEGAGPEAPAGPTQTAAPVALHSSQRYMPGLDGLRALAVFAVVAYHLGLGWAPAGLLGVGVFFTLSGYLITDLLLGQWDGAGRLALGNFWVRRGRRLLPALFVMLVVVIVWVALLDRSELGALWSAVGAAGLYVSNWWDSVQHVSYFARFGPASPLGHLWSLAIEEQFYLLWPWLLWLGLRYVRERRSSVTGHSRLASITVAAAGISALAMALLYQPGIDPTRVYEGTDTRAFGLLFGAALAMVWPSRRLTAKVSPVASRLLDGVGTAGLVVIALLIWLTTQYSPFLYRGGMVLLSVATMMTISAVVHPATRLGHALGREPLRWLGVRSYAIYLWMFPVITLTTPTTESGVNPLRAVLQVGAIIGLAALSWTFVEKPIRQGALGRHWARVKAGEWRMVGIPRRQVGMPRRRWLPLAGAVAITALVGIVMVGGSPGSSGGGRRAVRASHTAAAPVATTAPAPPPTIPVTTTSCRAVVHIGDSTSEGLTSTSYLPDPAQRIDAQYARVGVTSFDSEISCARSVVERYKNEPNGDDVAHRLIAQGYHGCWVLALGTNEAADVAVGSSIGLPERIDRMMADVGTAPVLWVNVKSLVGTGPYAENRMADWDNALVKACSRYPNMRVFDWASVVNDSWFISDGIHFTTPGYAARSQMIADALVKAFPGAGAAASPSCVVR